MLDMVRVSLPAARARSFTWPLPEPASVQKKPNEARWISSSNWSSVCGDGPELLCEPEQVGNQASGTARAPAWKMRRSSRRGRAGGAHALFPYLAYEFFCVTCL